MCALPDMKTLNSGAQQTGLLWAGFDGELICMYMLTVCVRSWLMLMTEIENHYLSKSKEGQNGSKTFL